jgi:hypothetical protein
MLSLFFRAVGILLLLRGIFNFGYLLLVLHLAGHDVVTDVIDPLWASLGSSLAGGLLVILSPWLARFTIWGFRE